MQTHDEELDQADRDPVTGEPVSGGAGFEPEGDAPIPLATPKPKVKTIDKKKVAIVGGAFAAAIAIAFITAFAPKNREQKDAEPEAPQQVTANAKAEALNGLPADYGAAARRREQDVPQLGAPMPGELGGMQLAAQQQAAAQAGVPMHGGGYGGNYNDPQQTARLQFHNQLELERLKRAASAKDAGTGFGQGGGAGGALAGMAGLGGNGMPLSPEQMMQQAMAQQQAALGAAMPGILPGTGGPGSGMGAARDDANRQDDKRSFSREKGDGFVLNQPLMPAASPTVVSAGTLIPALFLTGINSDLPGTITAQVSQPVYDTPTGRHVIIPQGSMLLGTYDSRVTFGQNRVLLVWQRLRFPNGSSIDLEAMPGVDMSGYAGVRDKVNNHWGKLVASVVLSSTVAATVAVSQGSTSSAFQSEAKQEAAQAAGQAINQAGSQIVQRSLNVQPTLEIRPGQRVAVMVNKDLALMPYAY